jgi:hypothetical protein
METIKNNYVSGFVLIRMSENGNVPRTFRGLIGRACPHYHCCIGALL